MNDTDKHALRARLEQVIAETVAARFGNEREAAEILGVPVSTIRSVINRVTERVIRTRLDSTAVPIATVVAAMEAAPQNAVRAMTDQDVHALRRMREWRRR